MAAVAHPQLVGNSFVSQYYNVLHQSPQVVHRFYTDASCLTRAEAGPAGRAETVFSQNGIHEKVMSMDYVGLRAEIKTVDCQDSYSGSVLVMVTGSLSDRSNGRRDFVQTFFLAPQEKGYFVLNDIFRYLDEPPQVANSSYVMANGVQEHSPTPDSVPDPAHLEVSESTPVAPEEQVDEGYDLPEQEEAEDEIPIEETVQHNVPLEADETVSVDLEDAQRDRDQPKKSYASILRVAKDGNLQHVPQIQKPSPVVVDKPVSASPRSTPATSPALPPPMEPVEEATAPADAQEGKSIYIKNLPMSITVAQLDEEFQKFGAVKSGCTNIKKQQNVCYAFLEFEDASSARAAVQASSIQINGKQVYIEEKRPLGSRAFRGRGRGRNDGARGRGYFGGRGGGRSYEPANRGRGGRGGYVNTTNSNTSNNPDAGARSSYNNNNNNNNEDGSSSYHPRYENSTNNTSSNANNNSNSNNSGNSNYGGNQNPNPRPPRRYFSRNSSFGRNSGAGAGAAPAAVTAA